MLPSEELRQTISAKYNIDLEQFAWPTKLKEQILSIVLDKALETHASTLEEIFQKGFNIGHCGLTSRYVARKYDKATLYYGNASLLKGTKNSPNGEHAWITINGFVIDTTLMICIPLTEAKKLGYIPEREIAHDSARILSEYDVFDHEYTEEQKGIILTHKKTNF